MSITKMSSTSSSTTWWGCSSPAIARLSETSTSGATSRRWCARATARRRGPARSIPGGRRAARPAFLIHSAGFCTRSRRIGGILHASSRRRADSQLASSSTSQHISMATTTLPARWSPLATRSREDLHQALLTSTCERDFADVPVDWWEEASAVWRPTSINRVLGGVWDVRRDVEVLTPGLEGNTLQRVSIAQVRLSRLLTAGVSRYWVARYQRQLVLRLLEHEAVPGVELESLRRLAARLRHEEALGYDVWATAYDAGAPEDVRYDPELPAFIDGGGSQPVGGGDVAALIRVAVGVLASGLVKLDAALAEARATPGRRPVD